MCKKKGKTKQAKNHKQNKKQRQKQMGMLLFRHIYKPKICGFSVILATMGDFSDNSFSIWQLGGPWRGRKDLERPRHRRKELARAPKEASVGFIKQS